MIIKDNKTDIQVTTDVKQAVSVIKSAILQSRAVKMISGTQLSLYFGVGLYVSANSRKGTWGTAAIDEISDFCVRSNLDCGDFLLKT